MRRQRQNKYEIIKERRFFLSAFLQGEQTLPLINITLALVNMVKKGKEDDSSSKEGKQPLPPAGHISPQPTCSSSFILNFSSLFYPQNKQTLPVLEPEDALPGLPGSWESNLTKRSTSDSKDSVDEQGMTHWSKGSQTC